MICPGCSEEIVDGADFCPHCKRYLRWEPTGYMPALTREETPTGQTPAAGQTPSAKRAPTTEQLADGVRAAVREAAQTPRALAVITLTVPGVEPPAGGAPAAIAVEPGQRGRVVAMVRNQSDIVDNYDLTLEGLPDGWATLAPATVHLNPFRSSRTYEAEVEIALHPPRTPQAHARHWPTTIVATSRSTGERVASAPLEIGLLPFEQLELTAKPDRRAGRRRARFELAVRNKANAPASVAIAARDTDGACRIRLDHETLDIDQGQTGTATLTVRPPRQRWIGRPFDWRIEISHATGDEGERLLATAAADRKGAGKGRRIPGLKAPTGALPSITVGSDGIRTSGPRLQAPQMPRLHLGGDAIDIARLRPGGAAAAAPAPVAPLLPGQVIYRQKAWLPWWLAVVAPLLAALALMLFLFLPRTATVPKLVGAPSVHVAQERLANVGLALDPNREQVVRAGKEPGSILSQVPAAGEKLEKGKAVTVQVVVGSGTVEVPSIAGQTLPEAEKTLRAAGLGIGRTSVTPPDLKAKISTQLPEAGEKVKAGAPIDVYYGKPKGAAGGGGGKADIAVPPIDPPDAAGFAAKLSDAGLVPQVAREISTVKRGDVVSTEPAAGAKLAKGATVRLVVSAGFPQIVYDDNADIRRTDPATGKALPALAKAPGREKDPSWSADGTKVAYNADGRIMLVDVTQPAAAPIPLTPAGEEYADPSFAPSAEREVLAVAKVNADGDRDLCLAPVDTGAGAGEVTPSCLTDPSFSVSDAKWSPDGRTILVPAVKKDRSFGLVRYRSARAFSSRTLDWKGGTIVTPSDPSGPTGVRDGAFSPDGKQLAMVSNLDSPVFRLYLTTPDDLRLEEAKALPITACKVAWRPDSKELLVTQSGADCGQETGQLLRVGIGADAKSEPVSAEGDNASYQPVVGGG